MKYLLRFILPFTALFSLVAAGCDLFSPEEYAHKLTPVDSLAVFHNLVNAYNTLDYDALLLCLDSADFRFIPRDTTQSDYLPWGYDDEEELTRKMFDALKKSRRIPPLLLQVDTTYLSASDSVTYLHANYFMVTPVEDYDTLAGGFEFRLIKRGNYWYVSTWKDVEGDTIYLPIEGDTLKTTDTIPPPLTDQNWGDLKVYFLKGGSSSY